MSNVEQMQKMKSQPGFIAALDQSGGSTPHALALGTEFEDHSWKDDDEMFELVHEMRTRVITSPSFTGSGSLPLSCSRTPWTARSKANQRWTISGM